jgi:protein MpaA
VSHDQDPYRVLGVPDDAAIDEIRSAYRRLALQHHPDVTSGSAERMAALNRAYAVLGDPEQRRRYDAAGARAGVSHSAPKPVDQPARSPREPAAPPWAADLDGHADDWRQMYEEERKLWEQLLAAKAPGDPSRGGLEDALAQAKRDQLELENALRGRAGLGPIDATAFESQRLHERSVLAGQAHAGCLGVLVLLVAAALVLWPGAVRAAPADTVIGDSQSGEPLIVHHVGEGVTRVLIVGGQHGGPEANTVQLVTQLDAHFEASPAELPANVGLDILTVANPDGLSLGVRQFLSGVDPNRNWGGPDWAADAYDSNGRFRVGLGGPAPFSEPETRALADYVLKARPAFVINYHSAGGFIFGPRSGPGSDQATAFAAASGYYWPEPGAGSPLTYRATGSMNVWLREVGVPGLLVELTSARDPEVGRNLAGLQAVLALLS